jgi:hypothetical protein
VSEVLGLGWMASSARWCSRQRRRDERLGERMCSGTSSACWRGRWAEALMRRVDGRLPTTLTSPLDQPDHASRFPRRPISTNFATRPLPPCFGPEELRARIIVDCVHGRGAGAGFANLQQGCRGQAATAGSLTWFPFRNGASPPSSLCHSDPRLLSAVGQRSDSGKRQLLVRH